MKLFAMYSLFLLGIYIALTYVPPVQAIVLVVILFILPRWRDEKCSTVISHS